MKINRRLFLSFTAMSGASIYEGAWAKGPLQVLSDHRLPIQQGYTNEHRTEFSIIHWKNQPIFATVEIPGSHDQQPFWTKSVMRPESDFQVLKVAFDNLSLGIKYRLVLRNLNGNVVDERFFQMLDLSNPTPKIAVISCMNDYIHRQGMWDAVADKQPDMMFFIGDSVYADQASRFDWRKADPEQLWRRFSESRFKLGVYKMKHLIPIIGIWDDHDYGSNNSNRHYPYPTESLENFLTFFAQSDIHPELERGPGLSMIFKAFGKDFYFLDGRTFRTAKDEAEQSVFGREQEDWLFSNLRSSQKPSWLITGSQWFGAYFEKEAYEYTHPESFKDFLRELKNTGAQVHFVSGDIHFSEVMKIEREVLGYITIEITSSSIHSFTFPGWHLRKKNPRRVKASSWHNFNIVEFEQSDKLYCRIDCIGVNGESAYRVRYGTPRENETL